MPIFALSSRTSRFEAYRIVLRANWHGSALWFEKSNEGKREKEREKEREGGGERERKGNREAKWGNEDDPCTLQRR